MTVIIVKILEEIGMDLVGGVDGIVQTTNTY